MGAVTGKHSGGNPAGPREMVANKKIRGNGNDFCGNSMGTGPNFMGSPDHKSDELTTTPPTCPAGNSSSGDREGKGRIYVGIGWGWG